MNRTVVRTLFVFVFTSIAIVINASDLMLPWHPYGGFNVGIAGGRPNAIAGLAARLARPGEQLDIRRMSPADRFVLGRVVSPGRVLKLPFTSGRVVTLVAQPLKRSAADNITDVIEVLATLAYLLIAAALVLLRPAPATWAFYVFSYGFCLFAATPNTWPFAIAFPGQIFMTIATSLSPAAFVSFTMRFPDAVPNRSMRALERVLLFVWTPLLTAWSLFTVIGFEFGGIVIPNAGAMAADIAVDIVFACGIAVLLARYATAPVETRNRLRWVVGAFAIAYVPFLILTFGSGGYGSIIPFTATVINLCQAWEVIAPIALAYTVLKHRLFDVRFVLSRALMYALLMSLTVGALALIDWGFSRWLEQSRFALIIELALAVSIGVMLTMAHRRVERFLNTVIFRAQTLALAALRRFALETDLIADPDRLLTQTYEALRMRLECDYAAIYTAEGTSFVLATSNNDATPPVLAGDDFAVLRLRRWSEPFECDEPVHPLRGALLVPMTARTQLGGLHRLRAQTRPHALFAGGGRYANDAGSPGRFFVRMAYDEFDYASTSFGVLRALK